MSNETINPQSPKDIFYRVTIQVTFEDEKTGKMKKRKEYHLIDAVDLTDIEKKVAEAMEGSMLVWKIVATKEENIAYVY